MFGGGVTPPEGCIHFKTSEAMDGVNFFESITDPNYDFSFLDVYVNDELTDIPANALTAEAGDDIRIVSRSKLYPFFCPRSKDYIASIEEPLPFMDYTDFSYCFGYCRALTSIPAGLFANNPNVTDFSSCFSNCSSLTSIPAGLFDNNPNVTDFRSCFDNCTSLTSIPFGLFDNNPNVTNFNGCFDNCRALTSIPAGLFDNNPNITNFGYCFAYCTSLTSIPQGLFDNNPNVTYFGSCFSYCISLTSIPVGLFNNNTKVYIFSNCFQNCEKLKFNVQIGSTTTRSVSVGYFAHETAAKGTVYCRAGSEAYNAFLGSTSANVNVRTY